MAGGSVETVSLLPAAVSSEHSSFSATLAPLEDRGGERFQMFFQGHVMGTFSFLRLGNQPKFQRSRGHARLVFAHVAECFPKKSRYCLIERLSQSTLAIIASCE